MEYAKDYIENELKQAQILLSAGNEDARGEVKFWEAKLAKFNKEFVALQRFKKGLQVKRGDELEFLTFVDRFGGAHKVGSIKHLQKETYILSPKPHSSSIFFASCESLGVYFVKIKPEP